MTHTLFVSDLHLDPERPAITQLFLDFLAHQAGKAEAIYVLGDLFEAWIGDDDTSSLNQAVCAGLNDCASAGSPVYVMHGNRDFLLGERFARLAGCTLLEDPTVIDLYGTPTLLMHGDLLCTDDTEYMQFRDTVRDATWQSTLLARPLEERRAIAREMRQASREQNSGKPEAILDVNAQAVIDTMTGHGVRRLIHGHTHRPGIHDLVIDGQPAQRMVLGDWYEQGSLLECNLQGCRLQTLSLPRN
ncbi:MAG: UDP-2,3-diacylglucosamine diphosphatase [Gammaproteobacteria bacterium]|nr:UDP-2,3-diacylglucosamine diphosphatase [Gammaproteobacteria bacterium]